MNVVIQNGATHGLTRREMEAIVGVLPSAWRRAVKSIILYQAQGVTVYAEFYPKKQVLGLFWPLASDVAVAQSKADAIEELLVSLALVSETGSLPKHIASSMRKKYIFATEMLKEKCLRLVGHNADQ